MIQLVFVFGVVLPTLVTIACFIGFLICWFRFRSLKRHHVSERKSSGTACPRRCRVYVASSSATEVASTCSCRTSGCFPPSTGSSIPAGWATHLVDRERNNLIFPPTTNEVERHGMSIKHPDTHPSNCRSISGIRSSTTLPGLLSAHQHRRGISLAQTGTMHCLSNAAEFQPKVYISGIELQTCGRPPPSRAVTVDACYVEVEPIIHSADCPTASCKRPRISLSRSIDGAFSKPITTTSGLSGGRKLYVMSGDDNRMLKTPKMPPMTYARRHHSLTEVPRHGELKIKTGDQTSLDF